MSIRKISAFLSLSSLLFLVFLLLAQPQCSISAVRQGLTLCAKSILPALFPFFVVSHLLLRSSGAAKIAFFLRPVTRMAGFSQTQAPLWLLLSWLGGYAVGAQTVARAVETGELSARQGSRFLILCICSSPGFVVGLIGVAAGNPAFGVLFYLTQLAASFLCCMLLQKLFPCPDLPAYTPGVQNVRSERNDLSAALQHALSSSLTVSACVLFFLVLCFQLSEFFSLSSAAACLLNAVLEICSGCTALCTRGGVWQIYGVCALLSFYSLSVWMQLSAFLNGKVSLVPLLVSRAPHFALSMAFLRFSLRLWPGLAPVYSSLSPRLILRSRAGVDRAVLIFLLCCLVLRALNGFSANALQKDKNSL